MRIGPPIAPPPVHLARDHERSVVAALVRDGTWQRVRPGAYVDAALLGGPDDARTLALARMSALRRQLTCDAVVSHTSAALLWGLPVLRAPTTTHITQRYSSRAGGPADLTRHRPAVGDDDVVALHGLRVTSLERTVVDCARTESIRGGVVVADAALHRGADVLRCHDLLTGMAGRRGVVRARTVLDLADDGAESAGESLARVALLAAGAPPPQTQVAAPTHLGTYWADVGWPEACVLAEYDGRGKYAGTPDAVLREKRREDALFDAGWRLLRLVAEDLRDPATLTRRLRRLFPALTPRPALLR